MNSVLRTALVTCSLALLAGCSSEAPSSGEQAPDGAGSHTESLRRPQRPRGQRPPQADPCASARCAADTHCEVVDAAATCAPNEPTSPCAAILCPAGSQCEVVNGEASCSGLIPPAGEAPFCGGIAAFECPGAGSCVDDPADDCEPEGGGADCGGLCECNVRALCVEGNVFDASPEVCACVPAEPEIDACALVRCAAGTHCELREDGSATCAPDDLCALTDCPPDRPRCEVVDGEAVCTAESPLEGPLCGGIAGVECPGAGSCAAVLCAADSRCVARGDEAHCVPSGSECRHAR